jgi:pimeloyl-[acyl-carrier protein] methyl ester esterase
MAILMMRLVLLPGLDGTGVLFRPLLSQLPREIVPLVISYPPTERLGYNELLEIICNKLPEQEPFVVLGESFSGPLAIKVAARQPAGLRGVILVGTFVRNPLGTEWNWLRHITFDWMFRGSSIISRTKMLVGGYGTRELIQLQREALEPVAPTVLAHRIREVLQVDARDELQKCAVSILDIRGNKDEVVWQKNACEIRTLRADVRRVNFDAPHLILQTKPVECAREIEWFVRVVCTEQNSPT